MKTVSLLAVTALSLATAWRATRQRNAALSLANEAAATTAAAMRSLQDANERIEDLSGAMPVWLLAGLPMVDVVPMAEDFCLN